MKKNDKLTWGLLVACLASMVATLLVYRQLPPTIATHFNAAGQPDSFNDKSFIFITALLPLVILLLMSFLPKIDPRAENYQKFSRPYTIIKAVITLFFIALHAVMILYALKIVDNTTTIMIVTFAILFIVLGNYTPKLKHNYFIGIRTPWTLASEASWRVTHRWGGYLFTASGIISFIGLFVAPQLAFYIVIGATLTTGIVCTIISYVAFKRAAN